LDISKNTADTAWMFQGVVLEEDEDHLGQSGGK